MVLRGLGFDAGEEFFAKGAKTDGGAIIRLVAAGWVDKLLEGGSIDTLPVGGIIAGGDGEDLGLAGLGGDFGKNTVGADSRVLERGTDATQESGFVGEGDFSTLEATEENLAVVRGDGGAGVESLGVGLGVGEIRDNGVLLGQGGRILGEGRIDNRDGSLGVFVFVFTKKPLKHKLIITYKWRNKVKLSNHS